jgi:hypothetical protein
LDFGPPDGQVAQFEKAQFDKMNRHREAKHDEGAKVPDARQKAHRRNHRTTSRV